MRDFVSQLFLCMTSSKLSIIKHFLEDNCLFVNYDRTLLGKEKIINFLKNNIKNKNIQHLSILNSYQDKKDTLFITYNAFVKVDSSPIYGAAIIRMKDRKINYVKNYIVK